MRLRNAKSGLGVPSHIILEINARMLGLPYPLSIGDPIVVCSILLYFKHFVRRYVFCSLRRCS